MANYIVKTEFGDINVVFDNIGQARADARRRFGITNPGEVSRVRTAKHCDSCDSAPCTCCGAV